MNARPRPSQRSTTPATLARDEVDYAALAELRHQIRRFLTFSEGQARAAGIEPQQHQLLLAIKGLPPAMRPTISVLAERMLLRHHTVVGLVDRLVAAKLAVRTHNTEDRREILVHIAQRGERQLRALSLAHESELTTTGPALVRAMERVLTRQRTRARAKANA
jgi:DNA-binding MarR family transcriptional regulator